MAITTPILLVAALALLSIVWIRGAARGGRFVALALFSVYLVGVAHYALLPIRYDPTLVEQAGAWIPTIAVKPFFLPGGDFMSFNQVYLNVLLGIPFGFGLPFVRRTSFTGIAVAGIGFGVVLESLQFVLSLSGLALPPWTVDVNDVILNATGVVIGGVAYELIAAAYRGAFRDERLATGIWSHFHRTMVGSRD